MHIEGLRFAYNMAGMGGAIEAFWQSWIGFQGCDFVENRAGGGGAVCAEGGSQAARLRVERCTFTGNRGQEGADLWLGEDVRVGPWAEKLSVFRRPR